MDNLLSDETGAVTVDWVVLTAGLVGLGVATMQVVSGGVEAQSTKIAVHLNETDIIFVSRHWGRTPMELARQIGEPGENGEPGWAEIKLGQLLANDSNEVLLEKRDKWITRAANGGTGGGHPAEDQQAVVEIALDVRGVVY